MKQPNSKSSIAAQNTGGHDLPVFCCTGDIKGKDRQHMNLYDVRNELNQGKTIYDLPLRVTYYARVSTEKEEQLHSLAAQVDYYRDFIARCNRWTFVEGYIDEGVSGTGAEKREHFMRMIHDGKNGRFDFVVTKEISRFSRSTLDSIQYTQELLRCGVGVFFQSDNLNTLMPDAELRLTILSSIAQDEVRKISERVKFGFQRAIESGVVLGNNRIWGYEKQNGKLIVRESEAEIVRIIFDLYANQKMGIRAIADRLTKLGYQNTRGNDFSFSTIRGILVNPKYKGYYCGRKSCKYDYRCIGMKIPCLPLSRKRFGRRRTNFWPSGRMDCDRKPVITTSIPIAGKSSAPPTMRRSITPCIAHKTENGRFGSAVNIAKKEEVAVKLLSFTPRN